MTDIFQIGAGHTTFLYVGIIMLTRGSRTRQVYNRNKNTNATVLSKNNIFANLGVLASTATGLLAENQPANLSSVTFVAGKKAATTLFPPPDNNKTAVNVKAAQTGVPEVQLEQLDEELQTSVLLPPYIRGASRNALIEAWKNLVSGQAFSGSYLEFYGQKWVYRTMVEDVFDCQRDIQRSYTGETFQNIFLNKSGVQNKTKKTIFLKSKFSLSDVNSIPGWKELQLASKGANDVEPDIIVCKPGGAGRKPIVYIVEMKIGLGKTDSVGEHHQLCRTKRTCEKWLDDFEATVKSGKNSHYKGWIRPDIKLVFVGWAAPSAEAVVFKRPSAKMGRSNTRVPYTNNSGRILDAYSVEKMNSVGFGQLSGIRAGFITKIVEELNFKRANAFYKAMAEVLDPESNLGKQVAKNRQSWLNNFGTETRASLKNETIIKTFTKKKPSSATAGTIQKVSNTINMELKQSEELSAAIGKMLRNVKAYNSNQVEPLINKLKTIGAARNNWLSLRNYMMANNRHKNTRSGLILAKMVAAGVAKNTINNVFRNVYTNYNKKYSTALQLARGPPPGRR